MQGAWDDFKEVIGKIIKKIAIRQDVAGVALRIEFSDGYTLVIADTGQQCCESRFMTCDDPLEYYEGLVFMGARLAGVERTSKSFDEHEVQFLLVETMLGSFTVASHNQHNGYYGGFSITSQVIPPEKEDDPEPAESNREANRTARRSGLRKVHLLSTVARNSVRG